MFFKIVDMENKIRYRCDLEGSEEIPNLVRKIFTMSKCIWIYDENDELIMKRLRSGWQDFRMKW